MVPQFWETETITAIVAAIVGAIAGSRLEALRAHRMSQIRDRERQEADQAVARLRREIVEGTTRAQELAETFVVLPEVVRDLFATRSARTLAAPVVRFVELLLQPEQVAFFAARPGQKKLALTLGNGLPAGLKTGFEIDYGQGRVGHAATTGVCMDEGDFRGSRGEKDKGGQKPADTVEARGLRADVVAPITEGDQLFGVVSVGGARQRKGLEKKLLVMVADLARLALAHAERVRAADEAAALDGMTGLLSRKAVLERLEQELARAEREGRPVSVLMLDIDHFRHYNETNGAAQGDDVIRQLAKLLHSSVRGDDVVARYAGEEFLLVYPGTDKDLALRLAEQLRAAVEAYPFAFRGLQPRGAFTVSGGVASYPRDSRNARELIRCADEALFQAKGAGRNQVVAGSPTYLT